MAGHARYTAVLDACVLYPMALSDALMSLASKGLFAGKWTTRIEDEWIRNLEEQRPDLIGLLTTRRDAMRDAVLDWEVQEASWQALAPSLVLPDPDDVHVLAAAIAGHADCIVTAMQATASLPKPGTRKWMAPRLGCSHFQSDHTKRLIPKKSIS